MAKKFVWRIRKLASFGVKKSWPKSYPDPVHIYLEPRTFIDNDEKIIKVIL